MDLHHQQQQQQEAYQHQHQHHTQTQRPHHTATPAMQDPAELLLEQFPEAGKLRWVPTRTAATPAAHTVSDRATMQPRGYRGDAAHSGLL